MVAKGMAEAEAAWGGVQGCGGVGGGYHTSSPLEAQTLSPAAFSPAEVGVLLAWWLVRRL